MNFFKKPSNSPKSYLAQYWDERLYNAMFPKQIHKERRYFNCLLEERDSMISEFYANANHEYRGMFRLWLSETEFCDIPLVVKYTYIGDIEKSTIGYLFLNTIFLPPRSSIATIEIGLNHDGALRNNVSQLFTETKACSGKGIEITWSIAMASPPDWCHGEDLERVFPLLDASFEASIC